MIFPQSPRSNSNVSRDPHVHVPSKAFTDKTTSAIIAPLVTMLLLVPMIVCNAIHSSTVRLAIVVLAANLFVMLLSTLTRSKMIE
jgi:hypothetical protein